MNNQIIKTSEVHNYGLDIYRILSMMFITTLHVVNQHLGLLSAKTAGCFYVGNFLEFFCYSGVDCFALLSGFLLVHSDKEYGKGFFAKAFELWLRVFFFSVIIYAIFCVFHWGDPTMFRPHMLLRIFLPVSYGGWWYIRSYFGLLFIIPLLNSYLLQSSPVLRVKTALILFVTCAIVPTMLHRHSLFELEYWV